MKLSPDPRRWGRAALPATLLLALAATPAVAARHDGHVTTAGRHGTTLRFVATDERGNMTVEDLGPPSSGGPGQGDLVAFTQALHRGGHLVGTAHVTAIGVDARRHLSEATGTLRIPHGTLQVAGLVAQTPRFDLAVTGGTGRYVGARGTMRFDAASGTQRIIVHLTRVGR